MKKGFTILELLVVIGIIGLLMAVMLGSVGGATESARATKCLAHLHNLASACQTVGMSNGRYPPAGSFEWKERTLRTKPTYYECKGWVSWLSHGAYQNSPKSHQANGGWFMSTYNKNVEDRIYSLTNGAIWKAVSGNADLFKCPEHVKCASKKKVEPVWSYVMNEKFGWDDSLGASAGNAGYGSMHFATMEKPDRRLLFAEIPFNTDNTAQTCSFSAGSGPDLDPTLQYSRNEVIGFNHKDGKRWYAHVCFADGHTEKLEQAKGATVAQIRQLTQWLCEAEDVSYDGKRYEKMQ